MTEANLWQIVLGTSASFLGGIGLYLHKKVADLSEECVKKHDCANYRLDVKGDFQRLEDNMREDFKRIEDKMTHGFNRVQDTLERRYSTRHTATREHTDGG